MYTVEINQMCRLCLTDEEVNVPIFDVKDNEEQVYQKITTCLPIQISRDDNFPKKICDDCSDKLNIIYRLWNTSANSEKKLFEWFKQWDANNKNTDSDFETLIDVGLNEIIGKEHELNQDIHIEEQLPHSTTLSETVEEEPYNNTIDIQNLQIDSFNQDICIEELLHCTTLDINDESCNNTTNTQDLQNNKLSQDIFIEEQLSPCPTLKIEEEEPSKNITDIQDSQNNVFDQDVYIKEQIPHSTTLSQESQNDSLNQDVSIEELSHSTTLEIVYSNTPEERLEEEQEYVSDQELEFSNAELPTSTTLKIVSSETVVEVQPITTCIVPTCDGNKNNTKKVFHPLPANEEVRIIWLKLISRRDLLEKPYDELQEARVCGAHFDESQYLSAVTKKFRCIVANCDGITNNKRRTWHSLPKDYELRKKWLLVLKRPDLQDSRSAINKVCSAHFASWQFRSPVSKTLNYRTIPLFMPETSNAITLPQVIPPKRPATPPKQNAIAGKQLAMPPKQNSTSKKRLSIPEKHRYSLRKWCRIPESRTSVSPPKMYNPRSLRKKRKINEK